MFGIWRGIYQSFDDVAAFRNSYQTLEKSISVLYCFFFVQTSCNSKQKLTKLIQDPSLPSAAFQRMNSQTHAVLNVPLVAQFMFDVVGLLIRPYGLHH